MGRIEGRGKKKKPNERLQAEIKQSAKLRKLHTNSPATCENTAMYHLTMRIYSEKYILG